MAATPSEPRLLAPADRASAPGWSVRPAYLLEVLSNLGTVRILVQGPPWGGGAAGAQGRPSDVTDRARAARDARSGTGEWPPGASDHTCNGGDTRQRESQDETGRVDEAHEESAIHEARLPGHESHEGGGGEADAGAAMRARGSAGEADNRRPPQLTSQVPGCARASSESRKGAPRAGEEVPAERRLALRLVSFERRSSGTFLRFTFADAQLPSPLPSQSLGLSRLSLAHASLSAEPATKTPLTEGVEHSRLHDGGAHVAFDLQLPAWLEPQLDLRQLASSPDVPFVATAEYAQIKLRLLPRGPHDRGEDGGSALGSMEDVVAALEAAKPVQLHCGDCGRQVTRPSAPLTRLEEMPSLGAVQEMSELWFCSGCCPSSRCGGGGERAQAILRHLQERLSLQPGKCLVGPTSLVLGAGGVWADQASPNVEPGVVRDACSIHDDCRMGCQDSQLAAEGPQHSANGTGGGTEPCQLGGKDNTAQSISAPNMQQPDGDSEEQVHQHNHGGCKATVHSGAADRPLVLNSAPEEASQDGLSPCCGGSGGAHGMLEAPGQSWTVPDLAPGKEPWREVQCACGAVLGACRRVLQVTPRTKGMGRHAGGGGQVPQLAALSLESPMEPNGPCSINVDPLDNASNRDTMASASLACCASTAEEPVHFYSYRTAVCAAGMPCTPGHWLDSQDRLIRAEEAFALQLALLFRPNATFSTRLVVRDVNSQRGLLHMSVLTCAGVLDAGLCLPVHNQTSVTGEQLPAARDGHRMDGTCGSSRNTSSSHSSSSSGSATSSSESSVSVVFGSTDGSDTTSSEGDSARAGWGGGQSASADGEGSACGAELRAVKVLFQDVHPATTDMVQDARAARASELWAQKGAEEIYLMESEMQLLREVLVQNSKFYPETVRAFGSSTCSFLRRKVRGSPAFWHQLGSDCKSIQGAGT